MIIFNLKKIVDECVDNYQSFNNYNEIKMKIENYMFNKNDNCLDFVKSQLQNMNESNNKDCLLSIQNYVEITNKFMIEKEVNDLHFNVNSGKYSCEMFVNKKFSFEYRLELLFGYIDNYLYFQGNNSKELIEELHKVMIMLFISLSVRNNDDLVTKITHLLICPVKNCPFRLKIDFPKEDNGYMRAYTCKLEENQEKRIFKKHNTTITITFFSKERYHNHFSDFDSTIESKRMLTNNERQKLANEFTQYSDYHSFLVSKPSFCLRNSSADYLFKSSHDHNEEEYKFLSSLNDPAEKDDPFFYFVNKTIDGKIHSFMFINKHILKQEYSSKWYCDDTMNTNKYNKNLMAIVVKDHYGFSQLFCWGFLFDSTEKVLIIYLNIWQCIYYTNL